MGPPYLQTQLHIFYFIRQKFSQICFIYQKGNEIRAVRLKCHLMVLIVSLFLPNTHFLNTEWILTINEH